MSDLQHLITQRSELDQRIEELRKAAKAEGIAQIRKIMAENGLTITDIDGKTSSPGASKGSSSSKGSKVTPKYKDAAGNTWSGRGLKPKWLQAAISSGKKLEDFAV